MRIHFTAKLANVRLIIKRNAPAIVRPETRHDHVPWDVYSISISIYNQEDVGFSVGSSGDVYLDIPDLQLFRNIRNSQVRWGRVPVSWPM
jgi:hypothetical protein